MLLNPAQPDRARVAVLLKPGNIQSALWVMLGATDLTSHDQPIKQDEQRAAVIVMKGTFTKSLRLSCACLA